MISRYVGVNGFANIALTHPSRRQLTDAVPWRDAIFNLSP
jgi:hypothetical protein